ncbi:MAG: S9 family peptidase [Planctomycetes bacterium]|nr:S9 family peptidase [Planctomycetota bacterium]
MAPSRTLPFLCLLAALVSAQEKQPLLAKDYGQWESLRGSGTMSPDGKWLAYSVSRSNGKDELRLREIASDKKETFAYGKGARFSEDGRWLGYLVGMSQEKREKLEKAKKPVQDAFELRELANGETLEVEGVSGFRFSEDGERVAMKRYRAKGRKKGGADLVVRDLATGEELCFGNIGSYAWCEDAPLLAMIVDTEDMVGGSVTLLNAATGTLRVLDSKKARYTGLSWRDDAADLAFLRITDHDEEDDEEPSHVIVAWRGLDGEARKSVYDHRTDRKFPDGMRITSKAPSWRDAADAVFFGIRPWDHPPAKKDDKEDEKKDDDKEKKDAKDEDDKEETKSLRESLDDPAGVDVWHAGDVYIIPRQKKTASRDRTKSHLCAYWLDDGVFVRLADKVVDSTTTMETGSFAVGRDTTRHERVAMFGPQLSDIYLVNTRTGNRQRILERHKFAYGSSPDGNHLLYVKDGVWWSYNLRTDVVRAFTGDLKGDFINDERGVLTDENPPYGVAGWAKDSRSVLLNSRFDIWQIPVDGSKARRLTRGAETETRYRLLDLDPDEEWVDTSKPVYLSVTGERTKKSGFARLDIKNASLQVLQLKDKRLGSLAKAKNADVFVYSEQAVTDSPDVFVTGPDHADPRQITETNPQQANYAWSTGGELIDYESDRGAKLQGALFYPAGYERGKTYPMIVYIYEKRSQNLHAYTAPSERRPYNPTVFTSLGYFVYQPDIVYRAQNPGVSALECVVPAVKAVLAKGEVDKAQVGLVGHSWGAYQTAFIVTRSDLFAAGVAGAPLTNMMSMSMSIYWNSGGTDARIFHESQGRMDRPFWQDVETYMANSPIFGMDTLKTPLLIAFGDKDGAVDWHQGIEMYNAARLANKQLVMLVYEGENHGLRKKPNQVDYHWRVREWFGHYVKGEAAPDWITKGTSYLDREKELERRKKDKKKKGKGDETSGDKRDKNR